MIWFYWGMGIACGFFVGWTWRALSLYAADAKLCDYKDALERMRNERDMLQREVDFMQGNQ